MGNIAKKMAQDSKNILRREDYRRVKKMDRRGIRTAEIRFPE